jgi:hypothetical protein
VEVCNGAAARLFDHSDRVAAQLISVFQSPNGAAERSPSDELSDRNFPRVEPSETVSDENWRASARLGDVYHASTSTLNQTFVGRVETDRHGNAFIQRCAMSGATVQSSGRCRKSPALPSRAPSRTPSRRLADAFANAFADAFAGRVAALKHSFIASPPSLAVRFSALIVQSLPYGLPNRQDERCQRKEARHPNGHDRHRIDHYVGIGCGVVMRSCVNAAS